MTVPTTFHLRVWTRFFTPLDQVWAMKTDPKNVVAEFPAWARFSPDAALVSALSEGRPGRYSARLGLVIPWPTEIVAWEPQTRTVDRSENALFSTFEHEHLFEVTPDGCRYIDALTFRPKLPAQKALAILTERLFVHRHRVAGKLLPADPQATGVSVLRVAVEG